MTRPTKCRKVCCMPGCSRFGPLDAGKNMNDSVTMTVDEYESIRLIDLEGMTQEECSDQMNVARTTVQAIYFNARKKLSDSLINGKVLRIQGGEYKICEGSVKPCGKGRCCRRYGEEKQGNHFEE